MTSPAQGFSTPSALAHLAKLTTVSLALLMFSCAVPSGSSETGIAKTSLADAIKALVVPAPTADEPVHMKASLFPEKAAAGDTVTVVIKARIYPGWHIYSHVPEGLPYVNTTFDLDLGAGVTPVGGWNKPAGRPYPDTPGVLVFEGECVFTRELKVESTASGSPRVTATVGYQTCDANMCLPPTSIEFPLTLSAK